MWGIIPAAGNGTRIQPLAFSKELLPVGSRFDEQGVMRPRAVSEYLIERMVLAGVSKLCFVISPGKSDIAQYYGGGLDDLAMAYVIQDHADGLCDAVFRALPLIGPDEMVLVGLPDTIWFPADGLVALPEGCFSMLLFPVERPELFDAVETDAAGRIREIRVKLPAAGPGWIWGAFKLPGRVLHELHALWRRRDRCDEYLGTLINAWLAEGGTAWGIRSGESYVDVGTLDGYRHAVHLLEQAESSGPWLPTPSAMRRARA